MTPERRRRANRRNGSTALGRWLAGRAAGPLVPGPDGTVVAGRYRWRLPVASCFVVGDVIFCRHPDQWLAARPELLGHELHHAYQYARLGLLLPPGYALAAGWSLLVAGDPGSHNPFERGGGLAAGGYPPARPIRYHLRLRARWLVSGIGRVTRCHR